MKLNINLLPLEFREEDSKRIKFYKVQAIGIAVMLFMFFLASLTVALRILQSQNISQIQNKLSQSRQKVSEFKNTQASLFILKNRLSSIDQYLETSSDQTKIYKIITGLVPPSISLNMLSINRNGEVLLVATTSDPNAIDNLLNTLNSKERNEGRISQISVENINKGKDGVYRLSLKIQSKFI